MTNPYANPDNWRAVFYGEDPPNKNLTHGNLVTLNGTGQILFEFDEDGFRDEDDESFVREFPEFPTKPHWLILMIMPNGRVYQRISFKDEIPRPITSARGSLAYAAEAEFVIAYKVGGGQHEILKSRFV